MIGERPQEGYGRPRADGGPGRAGKGPASRSAPAARARRPIKGAGSPEPGFAHPPSLSSLPSPLLAPRARGSPLTPPPPHRTRRSYRALGTLAGRRFPPPRRPTGVVCFCFVTSPRGPGSSRLALVPPSWSGSGSIAPCRGCSAPSGVVWFRPRPALCVVLARSGLLFRRAASPRPPWLRSARRFPAASASPRAAPSVRRFRRRPFARRRPRAAVRLGVCLLVASRALPPAVR